MTDRRKFMQGALALPVAAGTPSLHAEEPWPARTITLVVPFPPGGVADYAARPLAAFLSETLGKNVVVENKGEREAASVTPMSRVRSPTATPS